MTYFFTPIYASCSGRHDVWQGNANILQHFQSDRRSGASRILFMKPTDSILNYVTNLHQCATTCRSYRDHRFLWRHVTLYAL